VVAVYGQNGEFANYYILTMREGIKELIVEVVANGGKLGTLILQVIPMGRRGYVENVNGQVRVFIHRVGVGLQFKFFLEFLETIEDIF
jgi:hypothetical protein